MKITLRLAHGTHIDTVNEGYNSKGAHYHLIRHSLDKETNKETDIQAIVQGNISITPLYNSLLDKPPLHVLKKIRIQLAHELKKE